jgi:hypothetical protein
MIESDETEPIRRTLVALIAEGAIQPDDPTWTTAQLTADFDVESFLAPYVLVRRKADGQRGTLLFRHSPRIYFGFQAG